MGQRVSTMANRLNPFGDESNEAATAAVASPEERIEAGQGDSGVARRARSRRQNRNAASSSNVDHNQEAGSQSPLSERFFSTHFLMGGKRFELAKPDSFLFGNNADLDLLGTPVKFPYGGVSETVNALNALVNIRRDSIKLIRESASADGRSSSDRFRLQFIYDCDVRSYIQVHFCAREVVEGASVKFDVRYPELRPTKKVYCEIGAGETYSEIILKASKFDPHKMGYNGGSWWPIMIEMRTHSDSNSGLREQSQITMCCFERLAGDHHALTLKPLKQKLIVDGVIYLLQEVFGIENRETDRDRVFECSICKDNDSDTLLLPCRHLCICHCCDSSFLLNVKECPICRTPVKALLTLDAVRSADCVNVDAESVRGGSPSMEHVKLVEALNGPVMRSAPNSISRASTISRAATRSCSSEVHTRPSINSTLFQQSASSTSYENPIEGIELHNISLRT